MLIICVDMQAKKKTNICKLLQHKTCSALRVDMGRKTAIFIKKNSFVFLNVLAKLSFLLHIYKKNTKPGYQDY